MIRFECDYSEGACLEIIKKMQETNMEQTPGYGEDIYCNSAREKIRKICKCLNAEVQFLVGGTRNKYDSNKLNFKIISRSNFSSEQVI